MELLPALALTIRIYDLTALPPHELVHGRSIASDTLRQAGIAVRWIDCSDSLTAGPDCQRPPSRDELVFRIRHGATQARRQTLGDALVDARADGGQVATLYANRITDIADRARLGVGLVLGLALAHEVGHLLLGRATHPESGLMRAHWTTLELRSPRAGDWSFSEAEGAEMRRGLGRRLESTVH